MQVGHFSVNLCPTGTATSRAFELPAMYSKLSAACTRTAWLCKSKSAISRSNHPGTVVQHWILSNCLCGEAFERKYGYFKRLRIARARSKPVVGLHLLSIVVGSFRLVMFLLCCEAPNINPSFRTQLQYFANKPLLHRHIDIHMCICHGHRNKVHYLHLFTCCVSLHREIYNCS